MEGLVGIEPTTTYLRGRYSDQLSYKPIFGGTGENRTLHTLLAKQSRLTLEHAIPNCKWWLTKDSNLHCDVRGVVVYPLA